MASLVCVAVCVVLCVAAAHARPVEEEETLELRMPSVQPQEADTYLCFPHKLGEENAYVTAFEPHANMSLEHHMLVYGCEEPGDEHEVWNCGEMQSQSEDFESGPVCQRGPQIIYAWAMGAPELTLPEGVAFKVGGESSIKWLVLQVHYKDVQHFKAPENAVDHSGVTLSMTPQPQPKSAGVYLLATGGEIPPHSTVYMETACSYDNPTVVHPFAYRVHAHKHGEVVSGYRVRDGHWDELGRMSPKKEQMFYDVEDKSLDIQQGDIIAARCTMKNDEDRTVLIGSTQNDEMCNFYMMYYVDGGELMDPNTCYTPGPPNWYWSSMKEIQFENAPSNASLVPGNSDVIQATQKFFESTQDAMENAVSDVEEKFINLLQAIQAEYEEEREEEMLRRMGLIPDFAYNQYDTRQIPYQWWEQEAERSQEGPQYYQPQDENFDHQLPKDMA